MKFGMNLKHFPMLILASVLFTYGCGDSDKWPNLAQRSGMGSPMRYGTDKIKIKLQDIYLQIPENCLDSPIEDKGHDRDYIIDDSLLMAFILPQLDCRTQNNKGDFQKVGVGHPLLMVLIHSSGPHTDVNSAFEKIYMINTTGTSDYVPNSIKDKKINKDFLIFSYKLNHSTLSGPDDYQDAQKSLRTSSYIICGRKYWIGNRYTVPSCEHSFIYKGKMVDIHYQAEYATKWREIEISLIKKLNNFYVSQGKQ